MQKVAQNMFWHLKNIYFFLFQQSLMTQNFLSWPNSHNRKHLSQEKSSCDSRRGHKNGKSSTLASIIMQTTNRFGAQTDKSVVSHWCVKNVRLDIKRKARSHAGPPAHLLWVPLLHCSFWNRQNKKIVLLRGFKEHQCCKKAPTGH